MLKDNMSIGEINKLNYSGVGSEMSPNIIAQLIPDANDRKRFMDDYAGALERIFLDCGIDKVFSDVIDAHKDMGITNVITTDLDGLVVMSYASIMVNLMTYICAGKNSDLATNMGDLYKGQSILGDANAFTYDVFRNAMRTVRKQLNDIENSKNYNIAQLKEDYPGIISIGTSIVSKSQGEGILDIRKVIHEAIESITKLIFANKVMFNKTMQHPIDLNKYNIDVDRYAFYRFAVYLQGLENQKSVDVNRVIYPVLSYFNATKDGDTSNLYYYTFNQKTFKNDQKYTYKDFVQKLQDYVKTHREVNCDILPFDFFKGWDMDEVNEFLDLFTEETLSNFKEIDPEVLFLPNSKGEALGNKRDKSTEAKEKVFSLLPLEKREFYSKNRDKIHVSLLGEKKFKGYILNVLNNGYVIFEKYDTKEGDISSKSAAAYIMNIFNFKSLYTMSIREIREFIKSQDKNKPLFDRVDYKCHMGNWQEHLQKYFDEDTQITPSDVEEVLALEKVKAVQYKKEKEEE